MEAARAVHFPTMLFFVLFILIHVFLVFSTGALRNLNHMFGGTDVVNWVGFWLFTAAIAITVAAVCSTFSVGATNVSVVVRDLSVTGAQIEHANAGEGAGIVTRGDALVDGHAAEDVEREQPLALVVEDVRLPPIGIEDREPVRRQRRRRLVDHARLRAQRAVRAVPAPPPLHIPSSR